MRSGPPGRKTADGSGKDDDGTTERRAAGGKREEAETACAELAAALKRNGIVLPSLGVDPVSYGYAQPRPLIELGRCNLETTHRLIAVLDRAAR